MVKTAMQWKGRLLLGAVVLGSGFCTGAWFAHWFGG